MNGCVTLVDNETHTEWPIFVDLQLGSPPLAVDIEKHNKGPILLFDDEESEKTVKLIGKIFLKIFIILRIFILEKMLIVEGKEGMGSLLEMRNLYLWRKKNGNRKLTIFLFIWTCVSWKYKLDLQFHLFRQYRVKT
ncbi:hypothetical protein H5410_003948 [Solanum commersonii]|uniref:Uncharacterized protein n=1 Tax=Solanum commersonii TaxID=4109 RepID=A0A9J6B733_SOLCO|nr:hypothetical protein H5410_003948 [Solanum commersonii]